MITAICPGSFDPITLGHLNIIRRASKIFDNVVVLVAVNSSKSPMFSPAERQEMVEKCVKRFGNVTVETWDGLLVDFARKYPGAVIVKGLRAASDFDYEFTMNMVNTQLNPEVETMFLTASPKYNFLSSSIVREMARYGASLTGFVPNEIIDEIETKMKANAGGK